MELLGLVVAVIIFVSECCAQDSLASLKRYEGFREALFNAFRTQPGNKAQHFRRATELNKMQLSVPLQKAFPCSTENSRSPTRPTTVHQLRPGDIDVIGAIGDSLTASWGNDALNLGAVLVDNRGSSWSIGGEKTWREYLTLPNILKEFNPNLIGYSYGDSLSHQKDSQFNVAEAVAMSRDIHFQARNLWKRMRGDSRVDFKKDWKVVTLMIGPNDFCLDMCYVKNAGKLPENHRQDLISTLDFLRDNMPRTVVNLVMVPDLEILMNFTAKPQRCQILHSIECPCLLGLAYQHRRQHFLDIMRQWRQVEMEVANSDRYRTKDDFAVVLQPFAQNATLPTVEKGAEQVTDYSFLSFDCFHFSQKTNALVANALWNNMLEPVGHKSTDWEPLFTKFMCPTQQQPYIFTAGNSGPKDDS
ncbi:phospholipase B1, membrane-associated-like [Anabrus simplex]|uniref:phospholipase B1, membrane-associated-like n=1 Tax=Anabrus simplex TaxID=316456 RepID=UPI0035A3A69B